jgi:hypothetical protein
VVTERHYTGIRVMTTPGNFDQAGLYMVVCAALTSKNGFFV